MNDLNMILADIEDHPPIATLLTTGESMTIIGIAILSIGCFIAGFFTGVYELLQKLPDLITRNIIDEEGHVVRN